MKDQVAMPVQLLLEVLRTVDSIGVSLARLGSWEAEPRLDERFTAAVFADFLDDFDVCRKLLAARGLLTAELEKVVAIEELDAWADKTQYWEWRPSEATPHLE
jgi:hypothetical protein